MRNCYDLIKHKAKGEENKKFKREALIIQG